MENRKNGKRIIRNGDIPVLESVLAMMQEITMLENRREWEQERMINITQHLTKTPGGGNGDPHGLDSAFAALDEVEIEHREKAIQYRARLKEAEGIINGIENTNMRAFAEMMYVEKIPGSYIAKELNLTEWEMRKARESIESAGSMKEVKWPLK